RPATLPLLPAGIFYTCLHSLSLFLSLPEPYIQKLHFLSAARQTWRPPLVALASPSEHHPRHRRNIRFAADEPRKGSDVLVEALERGGVTDVFAYPGGASMEIHQALLRSQLIRNVLPRHEQGGIFVAEGYARASGLPGVCIALSGPGATHLVSGLAAAMLDSVPVVAITSQVPRRMIGIDRERAVESRVKNRSTKTMGWYGLLDLANCEWRFRVRNSPDIHGQCYDMKELFKVGEIRSRVTDTSSSADLSNIFSTAIVPHGFDRGRICIF
ncbi:acetolactate synthase 1, chloroplastic-like, partial [Camellia sinensis]|uniref:acetolactate synthase 1, chloroplastic-like n=1 Tax=Camellia sinensis TaxID=4442 RepID=UPI00103660E1